MIASPTDSRSANSQIFRTIHVRALGHDSDPKWTSISCDLRFATMPNFALPPCTAAGCTRAGDAIINQALLCSEHAAIEFERVLKGRKKVEVSREFRAHAETVA